MMTEITFYDARGKAVAYSEDGTHLFGFSGKPLGYITDDSIYAYSGAHLGWIFRGWIVDHRGNYVYYNDQAQGGPFKQFRPFKGTKMTKPFKGTRQFEPFKPTITNRWSNFSFNDFFVQ